jgi:DNA ligase-1
MRTGVQEGVLQAAVAQAFEKPLALIQRTQLLVGDLDEVAVLAKRNNLQSAKFRLFHPIQFMLATPQETAEIAIKSMSGRSFFAEDKLDGIRAQIHKSADRIAIYTRTMDRTDESFPDVVQAMNKIPGDFLLDGEIVPWCDGCVMPFAHIQKRLGRKNLTPAIIRENPAVFIAFDILYRDGQLLMDEPLRQRRRILEELSPLLLLTSLCSVSSADEITTCFSASRNRRNEGIVLKDPDSAYSPGRRGKAWLKIKTHLPTLDCVVTAAEYGHGKRKNVLSDYTFAVWSGDQLVNIGKAYSGVTDDEIAQLTEVFHKLSLQQRGHIHLVQPQLVLEVAFDQIQKSDRHASGYALRFPRIKKIRWDKKPEDADQLQRVAELYACSANTARRQQEPAPAPKEPEPTLFDGID